MDARFTQDQEMIRDTAAAFLLDWKNQGGFRVLADAAIRRDEAAWRRFGRDLGFAGLTIPAELGGAGLGDVERALIMEEMGRVLFMAPFLSTCVLAVDALSAVGGAGAQAHLQKIAAGDIVATLATLTAPAGDQTRDDPMLRTPPTDRPATGALATGALATGALATGARVTGSARGVLDADRADLILVRSGDRLFALEASAPGLTRTPVETLDRTRALCDLDFDAAPADLLSAGPGLAEALDRAHARSAIALAAEQVGGAAAMLDATVAYVLERRQFGRAIGSFQAVKHRCADMMTAVEAARSAVCLAAAMAGGDALIEHAAVAKSEASEAYFQVAGEAIQLHGGVGVTWDFDMHFHFKRARAGQAMLGSPQAWRERLASLIGL